MRRPCTTVREAVAQFDRWRTTIGDVSRLTTPHVVLLAVLTPGCGDDAPPASSGTGGSSTGMLATPSTSGDPPAPDSTGPTANSSSGTGSTSSGADSTGGGSSTGGPPWDGEPLPKGEPGQWQWVPVEGTECIDGSPTGLGVRYGSGDGLVVYFEGGGGCFDVGTCALFYLSFANFDENAFNLLVPTLLSSGIFDADNPDNPVRDWSFVYVPYCTGDVHAGHREQAGVEGVLGAHQFVGFRNFGLDLERIGPTFDAPSHVLVTGISAGGYGASYNYDRIADAYAYSAAPVTLLDDSGPPMSDTYIPVCLQQHWRQVWGLNDTMPAECVECFDDDGWIADLGLYLRDKHAEHWFGLLSSVGDATIRTFISSGLNDCAGGLYPAADYEAGLVQLRDDIFSGTPNFASYYAPGIGHTHLPFGAYTTTEVQGVRIVDWVTALLDGAAGNVSP